MLDGKRRKEQTARGHLSWRKASKSQVSLQVSYMLSVYASVAVFLRYACWGKCVEGSFVSPEVSVNRGNTVSYLRLPESRQALHKDDELTREDC